MGRLRWIEVGAGWSFLEGGVKGIHKGLGEHA